MVTCNAVLSTLAQQGQSSTIIAWSYLDDSTGAIIIPTSATGRLYNPNDSQKDPSNTAVSASTTFTPTLDTTGTVTGTINKHYVSVNFDLAAVVGTWYVETTFTHESVQRTQNICFNLVSAGGSVGGDSFAGTVPVYATAKDVENFLLLQNAVDVNSTPRSGQIDNYILMAEGEFEDRTGTAFKPITVTNEVHDLEAYRQRYHELFDQSWFSVPRPIYLNHKPILPFDSDRGHKIEVYEGSETAATVADPIRRWTRWDERTYGRQNDYWFDEEKGHLFVRKPFIFRRGAAVRITYEYGKPITSTTTALASTSTTIPVVSTHRYEHRGIIRIGTEYIHHTGKTETSFTGCTRGVLGTSAQAHDTSSEVYEVPQNIRRLITMRAATLFLENEVFIGMAGDSSGTNVNFSQKVLSWKDEWEKAISGRYQQWRTF